MSIRRPNVGFLAITVIAAVLAAPAVSSASLIELGPGPDPFNNSLQAATRILELTSQGSSSVESGCVSRNGAADDDGPSACAAGFAGGDEQPQAQTRSAGELGIASGSDLRIVFDALEPGNGDNGITIDALRLLVLDPTSGAVIFFADLAAPISLPSTLTGNGAPDLLLGLDALQAAQFDAAVAASLVPLADVRIGLNASLSDAEGGFEGFYVGDTSSFGTGDINVPEPTSLLLIGAGLGLCARRFRRS